MFVSEKVELPEALAQTGATLLARIEKAYATRDEADFKALSMELYAGQALTWGKDFGTMESPADNPNGFAMFQALAWVNDDMADEDMWRGKYAIIGQEFEPGGAAAWIRRKFPDLAVAYWNARGVDAEAATVMEALIDTPNPYDGL